MDGIPMSNDAGMTYNSGTTVGNNISLNRGVDMRTMPTDEIASVEIQQGIPSVEYGDLTSGLIKIKRKEEAATSKPASKRIWAASCSMSAKDSNGALRPTC